jgi:hypothetical protein
MSDKRLQGLIRFYSILNRLEKTIGGARSISSAKPVRTDRGFGSATRLMDRAADHSSAKWLKIWRREWDSNPATPNDFSKL